MKLRTRIKALNATRQAPSASGSRILGLGLVMSLTSKLVGGEKSRLHNTDDDVSSRQLTDGEQTKSLFRLGHTSRETLALIDASDHSVSSEFATLHPSASRPDGLTASVSDVVQSDAEVKNFVAVTDELPIEIIQSDTGAGLIPNDVATESLPNFSGDDKSNDWVARSDGSEQDQSAYSETSAFDEEPETDAPTDPWNELITQLNDHLQELMIFFGGIQVASDVDLFGSIAQGITGHASSRASTNASTSKLFSGAVIDGYVGGATVFADMNANGIQDAWEPFAITDTNGAYRFETSLDLSNASIVSVGGVDQYTGASIGYLVAPVGLTYVTPITTLLHYAQTTQSGEQLLAALGISLEDLKKDPIETYKNGDAADVAKAENILKTGASILTTVSGVSALVSGVSGQTTEEASKTVFSKLVSKIHPNQTLDEALVSSLISDSLPAEIAVNGDLVSGAAVALSQVLGKFNGSSLQDCWTYASIGQSILTKEILDLSKGNLTAESITAWKNEIQQGYESRLTDLVQYQKTIVEQKINADKLSFQLNADEIKIAFDDLAGLTKKFNLLENDSILVEGGKLNLLSITPLSKALPANLIVSIDGKTSELTVDVSGVDRSNVGAYGDFYFQYSAALENQASDVGIGVFKVQLSPKASEVQFLETAVNGAITESATAETTKIELSKVIGLTSVGPGDTLILDGLPIGTVLKQGSATLGIKTEGGPLTIASHQLLMFEQLSLEINGNFSGTINLQATVTSRYGSAVDSITTNGELVVQPTVDGLNAGASDFESAIKTLFESQLTVNEDRAFALINSDSARNQLIQLFNDPANYLVDVDGSETIQISLGIPKNWGVLDASGLPMAARNGDSGADWYVIKAATMDDLIAQLAKYKVIPEVNFNGDFSIKASLDSYEVSMPNSVKSGDEFVLMQSTVQPQPEVLHFNDAKLSFTGIQRNVSSDVGVKVDIASAFDKTEINAFKDLNADFVALTIKVPANYDLRLGIGSDDWYLAETLPTREKLYKLEGWSLSRLNEPGLQPLHLIPELGLATNSLGVQLNLSAQVYTNSDAAPLAVTDEITGAITKNIDVVIQPNLQLAAQIAPASTAISLTEAQTTAYSLDEWQPLKKWVPLIKSAASSADVTNWVTIKDINESLEFAIIKKSNLTAVTGVDGIYKIAESDFADLCVKSKQYEGGNFSIEIKTSSEQMWGSQLLKTESGSVTVDGEIQTVSSGVTSFNLSKPVAWIEGQSIAVVDFLKNENGQSLFPKLNDQTGEELFFDITVSKLIKLNVAGKIKSGILGAEGQRTYTLTEGELKSATLIAEAFTSSNDLVNDRKLVFAAYSKENGVRSSFEVRSIDFDINPISNKPKLEVVKQKISQLLVGDEKASLPIFVNLVDTGETIDVKILIENAPSEWVEANGNISSPLSFYLGNSTQPLAFSYNIADGLFIQLSSEQVSLLPNLQIGSSQDLRNENLVLSIEAGSTDSGATRATVTQDVSIEIFKPVLAPLITVVKSRDSDLAPVDLELELSLPESQQFDIDTRGISILVNGVPDGDYFVNQEGSPVGASLGDRIWILKASDIFDDSQLKLGASPLLANIQLVGEGQNGSMSFKTLVTDYVGGSSATAAQNVELSLVDPIVIDFDFGDHVYPALTHLPDDGGLSLELNPFSVGKETVHRWFTGQMGADRVPHGMGVFVKNIDLDVPYEVSSEDLFTTLDELNAFGIANTGIWLNANGDQFIDLGELTPASSLSMYFANSLLTLNPSKAIEERDYSLLIAADYAATSTSTLPTIYSANLAMESQVSDCRVTLKNVSGIQSNAPNAFEIREDDTYEQNEYTQAPVAYAFEIQYRFDLGEKDGSHFVKIFGVPEGALLNKGTFVQLDEQTSFWLLEVSNEEPISVAIKSLPVNFAGQIQLSAESITSYITTNGATVRWEGRTSEHTIDVLPVADTPIFPELKSAKLSLIEGGELHFKDLQIQAYTQDSAEVVRYQISNLPADATLNLNGDVLEDVSSRMFTLEELNRLSLDFQDFYTKDGSFNVTAYSQYPSGLTSAGVEKTIDFHFSTKADGVRNQSIETVSTIFEGDSIKIRSLAAPKDNNEKIVYEYRIGGSLAAANGVIGPNAPVEISKKWYKIFHVDSPIYPEPDGFFQSDIAVELNPFFNGEIEVIQLAASYDELSGSISEYTSLGSKVINIEPMLGATNNSYALNYSQNGMPQVQLILKEGAINDFVLKITSFDEDENFSLSDDSGLIKTISNREETRDALGRREFSYSIQANTPIDTNSDLTLNLLVEEGGVTKTDILKVGYSVIKGPAQPVLETVDSIRLFVDSKSEAILFDANTIQPAVKKEDSGDDITSYMLDHVPAGVQLANAKLVSKSKDAKFATYTINPSQLSAVKLLVLSSATVNDIASAFEWRAVNTEPSTGEEAVSEVQNIYLANKISVQPIAFDLFANDVLVTNDSRLNFKFTGGFNGESIFIQSTLNSGASVGSGPIHDEEIELSGIGGETAYSLDVRSLGAMNLDYFSSAGLKTSWSTLANGQDTGDYTLNLHFLPNPAYWMTINGIDEVQTLFQSGYFGNVSLREDGFNFIDPEYGVMLNEFTSNDWDSIDVSKAVNIYGTNANDLIVAGNQSSILYGAGGFNELHGSSFNDILIAGNKSDLMYGGAGSDIFQVALDLNHETTSRDQMDLTLANFLNLSTTQSHALAEQIQTVHQSAGDVFWGMDNNASYHLSAVVGDYARTNGNADRLVFTDASDTTEIASYTIKGETWGGNTDLIYAFAKDFADTGGGNEMSDITAVLMIPDSGLDLQLLDLYNNGISKT